MLLVVAGDWRSLEQVDPRSSVKKDCTLGEALVFLPLCYLESLECLPTIGFMTSSVPKQVMATMLHFHSLHNYPFCTYCVLLGLCETVTIAAFPLLCCT